MAFLRGVVIRSGVLRRSVLSSRMATKVFFSTDGRGNPMVELPGLGKLKGSTTKGAWNGTNILQFLNVRYGEPANGERRFQPPVPVKPWEGVEDVSSYKLGSPAYHNMKQYTPEQLSQNQEDCINLCVYTKNVSDKKPVIVYVHGGMFYDGAAHHYPPNYIMEKDVVLVVPQYRLGPLGFLSTKSKNIPGNVGILDVILALEWVQKYISSFGGDPSQVTLMAQSSGACMATALLFSPIVDTEKLFHKMIIQSGTCFASWGYDYNPVEHARHVAELAGCDPKAKLEEVEHFLMELDIYRLIKAFSQHYRIYLAKYGVNKVGGCRMVPGCPNGLFPVLPYETMRKGHVRKNLPILIGAMKHDGTFALVDIFLILAQRKQLGSKTLNSYSMIDVVNGIMGMDDPTGVTRTLQTAYFFNQQQLVEGNLAKMVPSMSDMAATCLIKGPSLKLAQINAEHQPNSTFLYSFDYRGEHSRFGFGVDVDQFPFGGGVHHNDDLMYLFPYPTKASKLNEADTAIAKKVVDLWTSFASNGVPRAEGVPEWPSMTRITGPYLKIDTNSTVCDDFIDEFQATLRDPEGIARKPKNNL